MSNRHVLPLSLVKTSPTGSPGPQSAPPFADNNSSSVLKSRIDSLEIDLQTSNENLIIAKKATLEANLRATRTRMTLDDTLNPPPINNNSPSGHPFHDQLLAEGFNQRSFFLPHSPTRTCTEIDDVDNENDDPISFNPVLKAMEEWHDRMINEVANDVDRMYRRYFLRPTTGPKRAGNIPFTRNPFTKCHVPIN